IAIPMKRANPNANGRVRNPVRRARLPKNSMNNPSAPMGVGMPCLSRQLARCAFRPRPPCQPKICCVECKKNVTARPSRRKTNEYDDDVSRIQLMHNLRGSAYDRVSSLPHHAPKSKSKGLLVGANGRNVRGLRCAETVCRCNKVWTT